MTTLNSLASRIANIVGKPNDHSIKERVKDSFKSVFATRIRQSVTRNGIDDLLVITCKILLEKVEDVIADYSTFKVKDKIPFPVRFENDAPFTYVGILNNGKDDGVPCVAANVLEIKMSTRRRLHGFKRYYSYDITGMFIHICNSYSDFDKDVTGITHVLLSSVFEDPEVVINYYSEEDNNDVALPFPADMIESIVLEILKTEFQINTPDVDVKS